MVIISKTELEKSLTYPDLIEALRIGFQSKITTPLRHHHDYPNPVEGIPSTLLLMPAWEAGKYLGVKIITASPNNQRYQLPTIQGMYILFDAHKGTVLAQLDAKTLTLKRTAAASALAASYLARPNSSSLLMIGTGALAPELIKAHATARPIKKVYIWGRNKEKAIQIKNKLQSLSIDFEIANNIETAIQQVDIISCATLSEAPLVFGEYLQAGQHLDLVGSYKPNMREADDEAIIKSSVFVDNYEGAMKESGDIYLPLQKGILSKDDIRADLFELCQSKKPGRISNQEITTFKSVGHALEDLVAAKLAFEKRT